MQCFQGKSVYKGIAMGPVVVLRKNDYQVKRTRIEDAEAEAARVDVALKASQEQLQKLYDKAVKEVGEASAAIFEVHQMMLEDEDYLEAIQSMIRTEQVNAEYAVAVTGDNFAEMFASMDDDYMKARSADIKDISERLVRNLSGQGDVDLSSIEPSVIVADDLSPSETVQMDKDKILAFVTVHGSTNSHTAILARMMNIPALIGVKMDLEELQTGMTAVVDGFGGKVTFEPDEELKAQTEARMQEEEEKLKLLQELKGKENITLDGRKINIYANIGSVADIGYVMENDAGGIGLFRSEFLYLGRNDFPTEEEQFQAYKQAVQMMVKIAESTEPYMTHKRFLDYRALRGNKNVSSAVGVAAVQTTENLGADCIVTPTISGQTARLISNFRPKVPIYAVSPNEWARRKMQIYWGVTSVAGYEEDSTENIISHAMYIVRRENLVKKGDIVVFTAGDPATNMVNGEGAVTNIMQVIQAK